MMSALASWSRCRVSWTLTMIFVVSGLELDLVEQLHAALKLELRLDIPGGHPANIKTPFREADVPLRKVKQVLVRRGCQVGGILVSVCDRTRNSASCDALECRELVDVELAPVDVTVNAQVLHRGEVVGVLVDEGMSVKEGASVLERCHRVEECCSFSVALSACQ